MSTDRGSLPALTPFRCFKPVPSSIDQHSDWAACVKAYHAGSEGHWFRHGSDDAESDEAALAGESEAESSGTKCSA